MADSHFDADGGLVSGLEGFQPWSLLRGSAALALWPPNADRVRALTALIHAQPLSGVSAGGTLIGTNDWRAWLAAPTSRMLREVVPDGYYDELAVVEAKIFSGRFGLLTGFLEAPDVQVGLWMEILTSVLERHPDERVLSAGLLLMAGAAISDMVIARAELGSYSWPDHSLEHKIGVPDEREYEQLCMSVEFCIDDFKQNTVRRRDLEPLIATTDTAEEDRWLKPLACDGERFLLASPAELHQATLTQAVDLALGSPSWMIMLDQLACVTMSILLRIFRDMDWIVEEQNSSDLLLRFDADKFVAVELLLAPVAPLNAPTVRLGDELERADSRLKDRRRRNPQIEFGLIVYVGDGRPVAYPLSEGVQSPYGPWLLSLGELRLLADALRLDPLGLWRLLLRTPPPPWAGGADLVDVLGQIRRLDETPTTDETLSRDGTEYLHQRARFMAARHPAPSPSPPGWITVSRWRGTPDVKIFAAEDGFAPFALLARGSGRFCWVVANAPVKDRYDLLAVLAQMTAFWAARLFEAGWLAPSEAAVEVAIRVLVNFDDRPGATLVVAPYAGGARVLAGLGFLQLLCQGDNEADRLLVSGLLASTRPLDTELLTEVVDRVAPAGRGAFMIWPDPTSRRVDPELDTPDAIPTCERHRVGQDVAANMIEESQTAHARGDAAQEILRSVNGVVVALLDHELEECQPEVLVDLIRLYEQACTYQEREAASLPSRAALPDSSEVFLGSVESDPHRNVALRGLVERVAAIPPSGKKPSSRAQLTRLRALAEALVEWGTASDALHAGLASAEVAIGAQVGCLVGLEGPAIAARDAVIRRLGTSISALMLTRHDGQSQAREDSPTVRSDESFEFDDPTWSNVDVEMGRALGFSLGETLRVLRVLSNHADEMTDKVAVEELDTVRSLLHEATDIPIPQVKLILASLTLTRCEGYSPLARELKLWKANRERSYLRRPVVDLADGRLAWGALHTLHAARYLIHLIATGRLPCDGALRRAVSDVSRKLDRDFEKEVNDSCERLGWETKRNLRKLGGWRIERGRGEDLGDLDVLALDRASGRLWLLDAKRISPSTVPIDMRREARSLQGYVDKHLQRLRWVIDHPEQLLAEIGPSSSGGAWVVQGALVSELPLAGAHLSSLELPVWSQDGLDEHLRL